MSLRFILVTHTHKHTKWYLKFVHVIVWSPSKTNDLGKYPSIYFLYCFIKPKGSQAGWSLSQLPMGERLGQVSSPSKGQHRDKQPCTPYCQLKIINQPNMRGFFGLWEEAGVTRENPHMHRNNMQTPHKKASAEIWTRNFFLLQGNSANQHTTVQSCKMSCDQCKVTGWHLRKFYFT